MEAGSVRKTSFLRMSGLEVPYRDNGLWRVCSYLRDPGMVWNVDEQIYRPTDSHVQVQVQQVDRSQYIGEMNTVQ